jgi:Fur family zinc uptake transcriptional regulator
MSLSSTHFSPATCALLDSADRICQRRGARLTDLRREVLGYVLESAKPSGAYDLMAQLGNTRRIAPPTVYRALDFLLEQGLVHKIERLSAFVGCVHGADHAHPHSAQFLICSKCGRTAELASRTLIDALAQEALGAGFVIRGATIEAEGLCSLCAANDTQPEVVQNQHQN